MAIRDTLDEREYDKFVESPTRAGKTAIEVTGVVSNADLNPYDVPPTTNNTTDVTVGNVQTIKHFNGATLLKTITITYSGCNKSITVTEP